MEITKKQLHVHTHLAAIEVIANHHRMEQVLTNFITNAIRYTPEKEDKANRLLSMETQLGWLRDLGFVDVDCYWKWLEMALLIGYKA